MNSQKINSSLIVRNRRDKIRIIRDILRASLKGSKKTHIMYKANLSHVQLKAYLEDLCNLGFMLYKEDKEKYVTTDKGAEFMSKYDELNHCLGLEECGDIALTRYV